MEAEMIPRSPPYFHPPFLCRPSAEMRRKIMALPLLFSTLTLSTLTTATVHSTPTRHRGDWMDRGHQPQQSAREKSNIGAGYQDLASLQGDNPRLIDIMDHSHAGQTVPCQTVKTALEVLGLMRKKPATVPCEAFLVTTENLFDGGVIKPLHVITCFHFSTYYLSLSLYLPAATPEHPPAASSPPLFSVGCEHWCHGQSTTQDLFQGLLSRIFIFSGFSPTLSDRPGRIMDVIMVQTVSLTFVIQLSNCQFSSLERGGG
ncbi:hypothetical protein F2P79_009104 [Pimephales promelas]|nr:hypothetical protein F2P79_009104 [Pimephales promelas]